MNKCYTCICGKKFTSSQSYNGHKSHCQIHQINKYGNLNNYETRKQNCLLARQIGYNKFVENLKIQKEQDLKRWLSEKHICERCGKVMIEYYGSGRFCSRKCANSKSHSQETKEKISKSVKETAHSITTMCYRRKLSNEEQYNSNPSKCIICGSVIPYKQRTRKTCSKECLLKAFTMAGLKSASITVKRSRNEILFCNLCENYFGKENVLHNVNMFNGWDADIILPQYKIAILWNGPWHYRKVTKRHNLSQVQNRDKIKCQEIYNSNYIPYIIKDVGKQSNDKVQNEFNKLLVYLMTI